MYKLSIITINYNNIEGLKRTVENVINQSWKEFEYIVIDGGSTDGSANYLSTQSHHFDYWISEPDKGIYNAMNKGIQKATGEYLLFLNSGDYFYNQNILEKYHNLLIDKDLIYFNLEFLDGVETSIAEFPKKLTFSYFIDNYLPHPSTFIKRVLFSKVGLYDEQLKYVSDWKFFLESVCKYNATYLKIDEVLTTFYLDGLSSDSQNETLFSNERQYVLDSEFSSYLEDIKTLKENKIIISRLKRSKIIKTLVKLRLLRNF